MHVRRALALTLAVPVLLAGCSDDPEPKPKIPEPTSSSPTPTPTESETPEAESPEDFIRRWVEAGDEMQVTGETAEYRRHVVQRARPAQTFVDERRQTSTSTAGASSSLAPKIVSIKRMGDASRPTYDLDQGTCQKPSSAKSDGEPRRLPGRTHDDPSDIEARPDGSGWSRTSAILLMSVGGRSLAVLAARPRCPCVGHGGRSGTLRVRPVGWEPVDAECAWTYCGLLGDLRHRATATPGWSPSSAATAASARSTSSASRAAQEGYVHDVYMDGTDVGDVCVPQNAVQQVDLAKLIIRQFKRIAWPSSKLVVQPRGGRTLVNFETNFYTPDHRSIDQSVTVAGQSVVIRAVPVSYTYLLRRRRQHHDRQPRQPAPRPRDHPRLRADRRRRRTGGHDVRR